VTPLMRRCAPGGIAGCGRTYSAALIGMSLATTAVLLTPVVLTLTRRLGLRALPFALLAVWLANTASLLLPVSNLTNLLALQRAHLGSPAFAARMALPELVAVAGTVAYLGWLFRRDLAGAYPVPERTVPADRWTFRVCGLACVALAPGVLAGGAPWAVAVPCAGAAAAVSAVRGRSALSWGLVPWRFVVLTGGLFLTVSALARHGLGDLLARAVGGSTLATVGVSAAIREPLATLLWREHCRAHGLVVPARTFTAVGLLGLPPLLVGCWAALLLTG